MTTTEGNGEEKSEVVEKSTAERELEDVLKQVGVIIVSENPEHRSGSTTYYRIGAKNVTDSEDAKPFFAQGVKRIDALKGVLVMSHAR